MLTSSLPARLRLERHTWPVYLYVRKNPDWPVYGWIAAGRQGCRMSRRIEVGTRMWGWISLNDKIGVKFSASDWDGGGTWMAWKHESLAADSISSGGFLLLWNISRIANGICRQLTSSDLFLLTCLKIEQPGPLFGCSFVARPVEHQPKEANRTSHCSGETNSR